MSKTTGRGGAGRGQGRPKGARTTGHGTRLAIKAEARKRAVDALELTETQTLVEIARLGFSNMLDYVTIGEDGLPYCDFSKMTRAQAAAIGELTVETDEIAKGVDAQGAEAAVLRRKVRFKLAAKIPALHLICQYFGLLDGAGAKPPPGPSGPLNADGSEKTPIEVARRIAFLLASAARQKPPS